MTETALEAAVGAAVANETEAAVQAVGAAWLAEHAGRLIAAARLRQRQAALVAAARERVDALRQETAEARAAFREAAEAAEAAEVRLRVFLNPRERRAATSETDKERGRLEGAVAEHAAARARLGAAHQRAQAAEAAAAAELARLEAGS